MRPHLTIGQIFERDDLVDRAVRKAAQDAVRRHWAAGYAVSDWRKGRTVWIAPDGSVLDEPSPVAAGSGNRRAGR
jgi:hypothetical protein